MKDVEKTKELQGKEEKQEANSEIRCRKCGKNIVTRNVQERGNDEPATVYGHCINEKCEKYKKEYKIK